MRRFVGLVAIATAFALAPTFTAAAPSASADHVVDQGCVHYREFKGPYGAFVLNAYLRCKGNTVRRAPVVRSGPNGACKTMVPHHLVQWNLWSSDLLFPFVNHAVDRLAPC
jgi:hypothetical protein